MNRVALIAAGVVLAIAAAIVGMSFYTVEQWQQALVLQLGKPLPTIIQPGPNWKIPLMQNVVYFDKRVLDFDADRSEVPTLDQKQIEVDAYARFRIVDPLLFYQRARDESFLRQQLSAIISSNLRQVFGEVPLSQVLSAHRAELMQRITENVNAQAKTFGVNVIDVRIKRVDLPDENSEAIYRRMQTQREQEARKIRAEGGRDAQALRAEADKKVRVIVADAQRRAQILRGEGESEATRIFNEAYSKDPSFFDFYRSLQAMSKGLGGDTTRFVGPPDGEFFRYFGSMEGNGGQGHPDKAAAPKP